MPYASALHCGTSGAMIPNKQPSFPMSDTTHNAPIAVAVEAGKTYYWCSCGKSASQPFCDGSHKGSGMSPVAYKAEESGAVHFCGCKRTHTQPTCDGSHKKG
jgi:CDGSH-type Zn-finger protein